MNKKHILLFLLILTAILCCSCKPKNKDFNEGGLKITLTEDFESTSKKGFDIYIVSADVVFSAVSQDAYDLEYSGYEINSLLDYSQEIAALNDSSGKLREREGYYYFTSKETIHGASYTYVHCMFSDSNKYWICEFVTKTKDYDNYKDDIFKWADSIEFEKE